MSTAIITTTINHNPESYEAYAKQGRLIVAGDMSTHADTEGYVRDLGGIFLGVTEQHEMAPELSDIIGWKSIQRRNMALLSAIREGFDVIITVDDDNLPGADFAESHERILSGGYTTDREVFNDGWINIGDFVQPPTWQRGTPYGHPVNSQVRPLIDRPEVVVSQSQVLGAPDCDAITRLTKDPEIVEIGPDFLVRPSTGTYLAWNSQATAYTKEFAPLAMVLPFVGRYDDIFSTFIARRILAGYDKAIHVGRPAVRQERNPHDFTVDLEKEVYGLRTTYELNDLLDMFPVEPSATVTENLHAFSHLFREYAPNLLPERTRRFIHQWSITLP